MNKKQLAAALGIQAHLSRAKALEVLNCLFDGNDGLIASELHQDQKVTIAGFGTFSAKVRASRVGIHPGTGQPLTIPSKRYAHFKPGKTMKERLEA